MDPFSPEQEKMLAELQPSHALIDIREMAIKELIRVAYRRKLRQDIQDGNTAYHSLLNAAVAEIGKDFFVADSKAGRKPQSRLKFITISAKDGIDPKKFMEQMDKCIRKQKLQAVRGCYVLEQRSEGPQDPYGWHIHWLVEFGATSSTAIVVQQTFQCFQRFVAATNYIDVRDIFNEDQWQQKHQYVSGKKSQVKMPKVWKDSALRDDLDIPHIISY